MRGRDRPAGAEGRWSCCAWLASGGWVRFGANTLKTFSTPSEPNTVLAEDIFFIDIGPVWRRGGRRR